MPCYKLAKMEKIQTRKIVIRTARSLKKKLEIEPRNEREQKMWYYLSGIYDTRRFGLVRYKLKPNCEF